MKKICLITCYKQPDYIRSRTLRTAFQSINSADLIIIKNSHIGLLRYFEVMWKLIIIRITQRPDVYFLTFRGYEILPFVRLITIGKPLIFDEFINLVEWVVYEHHKFKEDSLLAKILDSYYKFWLNTTNLITTDTSSHANYSSKLMNIAVDKYMPLIVSTDEHIFKAIAQEKKHENTRFKVFYYGNMLPLHGVNVVIEAMKLLKGYGVELTLIGGKDQIKIEVDKAVADGVLINYKSWVPFEELPAYIKDADVCLGGPFGGTVQSQFVITGKTYQFLQMGCPVIVGRNKESDIFTNKKDVLTVDQANPKSLADTILWAKQHRTELDKIGKAGHELYKKVFSNERLSEQLRLLLTNKHIL